MFGKLFAAILPRVKADDEELVDPQTVLRVSFLGMFNLCFLAFRVVQELFLLEFIGTTLPATLNNCPRSASLAGNSRKAEIKCPN